MSSGSVAIKILFLGANPSDTTRLALGNEVREITHRLRDSKHGDRFEVVQEWAVRAEDLQAALLRHKPQLVHFSGHGERSALIIEDASGKRVRLEGKPLADLFKLVGQQVRCVVLNACSSMTQAEAIRGHVDCVVSMSDAIRDTAAIAFAGAFYQALGFGESVEKAFELGKNQVELKGLVGADVPQLDVREGQDAGGIVLVPAPAGCKVAAKKRRKAPAGPQAKVQGSGAVAQGRGAQAAGAGGVALGEASGAIIITGKGNNVTVRGKR